MENEKAAPSELTRFKEHVDLYESILNSAEKRILARITPELESAKRNAAGPVTDGGMPSLAGHNPVVIQHSSDISGYLILGLWLGVLAYFAYKRGLFNY